MQPGDGAENYAGETDFPPPQPDERSGMGIDVGKKLLFIYNPRAGKGQIRGSLLDIIDVFVKAGYNVWARPTQYAGEAAMIARQEAAECDLLVCSGGDGTMDEVVSGVMQAGAHVPLGYIPAGSTNDFANSLRLPKQMKQAAMTAVGGRVFDCDVGLFNQSTFVYVAAFGLFTEVSYQTSQEAKNMLGHLAYLLEGVRQLGNIQSHQMRIVAENTVIEGDFLYGMITNSTSVGGFPGITGRYVDLSDGKFEVTLIRHPRNLEDLNEILGMLTNQDIDSSRMYCFKAPRLEIFSEEEIPWTLDGEFGGRHRHVILENRSRALRIMVPSESGAEERSDLSAAPEIAPAEEGKLPDSSGDGR